MTIRDYSNEQYASRVNTRSGSVSNDRTSNNHYWLNVGHATGKVDARDFIHDYYPPPQYAENRLYGNLVDAVQNGTQAELLTAGVEWKKSLDMVTKRATWLLDSYRSFRRFDLPETVRKLTLPVARPVSYHRVKNERGFTSWNRRPLKETNRQTVTSGWLEYWMGWAPAMGDIYNALDALQRPFPNKKIRAVTGYDFEHIRSWKGHGMVRGVEGTKYKGTIGCYADAEINNYNLYLMNNMGLINPLSTAFQIIPFSFVLNWFVNVEQILGNLTDFAGVTLRNTGTGILQTREGWKKMDTMEWRDTPNGWETYWEPQNGSYSGLSKVRVPGTLPTPRLIYKFDRLSLTRAATAVSLLTEIFLRKRD